MASTSTTTTGYQKADSANLPFVDIAMIIEHTSSSDKYNIAEIRGAKQLMSSRDEYLEVAVGYVGVKRQATIGCSVQAKIVPEHKIANKLYVVTALINENLKVVEDAQCEDCPAAAGGCKHALLLLYWLAKKSTEASCTSVQCYWRKPSLSTARTESILCEDLPKKKIAFCDKPKDPSILQKIFKECEQHNLDNSTILLYDNNRERFIINIFEMCVQFCQGNSYDFQSFLTFVNNRINQEVIKNVNNRTLDQADSKYWHYVRQGRITASRLYDAACCTTDGALVQHILGGYKVPETKAIKRGKSLEKRVLQEIEKTIKIRIISCGFILVNGLIGASPYGITKSLVIEVKCPISEKTFQNYVKNGIINKKYKAQVMCQMHAAKKKKGLLCIADPTFEITKKILLHWVDYDESFLNPLIDKAMVFWEKYVYPKVLGSAKA